MRKIAFTSGLLALMCLLAVSAVAANIDGKWTYEMTTPNGDKREGSLTLKAEGDKLTGTVGGMRGDAPISEGKISGDDVEFVVVRNFQGEERKIRYKGKVVGNELKLNVDFGGDRTFEINAKRATT